VKEMSINLFFHSITAVRCGPWLPVQDGLKEHTDLEMLLHAFFNLALVGGEWSASRSRCYGHGVRGVGMHYIGGCWSPEPSMDLQEKISTIFFSRPGIKLISSVFELVAQL
jgi:hypothetical protein